MRSFSSPIISSRLGHNLKNCTFNAILPTLRIDKFLRPLNNYYFIIMYFPLFYRIISSLDGEGYSCGQLWFSTVLIEWFETLLGSILNPW